jgi:hypothetical protein
MKSVFLLVLSVTVLCPAAGAKDSPTITQDELVRRTQQLMDSFSIAIPGGESTRSSTAVTMTI